MFPTFRDSSYGPVDGEMTPGHFAELLNEKMNMRSGYASNPVRFRDLYENFKHFDHELCGTVDFTSFEKTMRRLNVGLPDGVLASMFEQLADGAGRLDYRSFCEAVLDVKGERLADDISKLPNGCSTARPPNARETDRDFQMDCPLPPYLQAHHQSNNMVVGYLNSGMRGSPDTYHIGGLKHD